MLLKYPENIRRYFIHGPVAVNGNQPASPLIIISHRTSLFLIGRDTGLNYFQPVVITGYQPGPVDIANFIDLGRLKVDVIDPSTGGTRTASSNPEQQLIIIHIEPDHNRPSPRGARIIKEPVVEQSIQPSGLGRCPGKTVENITALAVRLDQPQPDHLANQIVGNQLPPGHDCLGYMAKLVALGYVVPQKISGGNLRHLVALHNALGLSALTGTRGTKQYDGTQID